MILNTGAYVNSLPAKGAFAITPHNTRDLPWDTRMITIGSPGAISFVSPEGTTNNTAILPAGSYPVIARRVRTSGTTASDITGWA